MKLFTLAFILLSSPVFADQCQWNSKTDARSAVKLLRNNDVIFWCQNCGEKKPSVIFKVADISVSTARYPGIPEGRIVNIQVQGGSSQQELDLAYTYVRTASDTFTNMAHMVGCPSEGATSFIQTGPGAKKVAHYYDAQGKRVNAATSTTDAVVSYNPWKSDRLPASKK